MYSQEVIIQILKEIDYQDKKFDTKIIQKISTADRDIRIILNARGVNQNSMSNLEEIIINSIAQSLRISQESIKVLWADDQTSQQSKYKFPNIKNIIVIASGKGGVGKSTIAAALGMSLSSDLKIGILDTDIYGPSIPYLFNINEQPNVAQNSKLNPIIAHNIELMSMGFLVNENNPVVWRGPMLSKALWQMIDGVNWGMRGELDLLIIDTPPGTGDLHLSLLTKYHVDGAIFVTTPHILAIKDTIKSIGMFRELKIPIIGIIENMSYHKNKENQVFGSNKIDSSLAKYIAHIPLLSPITNNNFYYDGIFTLKEELYELSCIVNASLGAI